MRLYFLRHAPAVARAEWRGSDASRPLTPAGEELARRVAERIDEMDLGLTAVVTSPYERAAATARIVCERLDGDVPLVEDPRLEPDAFCAAALSELLAGYPWDARVMLVGHEPSMTETMADIVNGGRFVLKKAGLARIDRDEGPTLSGVLRWLVQPGLLR